MEVILRTTSLNQVRAAEASPYMFLSTLYNLALNVVGLMVISSRKSSHLLALHELVGTCSVDAE